MRLRRICKQHPLGVHKGQTLYFHRSSCPTCRPDGWIHVRSAEAPLPSAEHRAELSAVLRAALRNVEVDQ